MDRPGVDVASWSNPELALVGSDDRVHGAADPEAFDASTLDPGHIISLIRQLLPHDIRLDSVRSELLPGASKAQAPECSDFTGKNGISQQDASQNVDGVSGHENGTIHSGQLAEKLGSGVNDTGGAALQSQGGSLAVNATHKNGNFIEENGNHVGENGNSIDPIEENGNCVENGNHQLANGCHGHDSRDLSRKRSRGGGYAAEQNGDGSEYAVNGTSRSSERVIGDALVALKPCKAVGSDVEDRTPIAGVDGGCVGREEDVDAHQKTNSGDDDSREEGGCVLWDLAATESHAEFLVENHILKVLLVCLSVPQSDRMREVCLGVAGNLACHPGPVKAMVGTDGLVDIIVQQLFVDNVPSLTETCRLLSAGLHSDETVAWVENIKPDFVLERIMWMAVNTLDPQLLEKCTELILAMVDSQRDAVFVLLPSLLRLGLPGLLTDLIGGELSAISEATSTRGDVVLDIVLQIAEAISISDDSASQLAASDELFTLSCQVIRLSARDEIGPSSITATVLIANLLTEQSGLIDRVLSDALFLGRLLALVPFAGDDPGARNALWSILGRICHCLFSTTKETPSQFLASLADGCGLLLDDLDVHQEEDLDEEEDQVLAGHDTAASTSRGLQPKLAIVDNLKRIMDQWSAAHSGSSAVDMPLGRSVRTARSLLKKYVSDNGVPSGSTGRESSGAVHYGDVNSSAKHMPAISS